MPCVLLTGPPGVGKSTVISRVLTLLAERGSASRLPPRGFYTKEMRRDGRRSGFTCVDIETGREGSLAVLASENKDPMVGSTQASQPLPRVRKYAVTLPEFEGIALPSMTRLAPRQLVLLDEIGKMELLSPAFVKACRALLTASDRTATACFTLATVAAKGGGLIQQAKAMTHSEVLEVSATNRDALPTQILRLIDSWDTKYAYVSLR